MGDIASEIRQTVTAMSRSELIASLDVPLRDLRPIDLERILETLKSFHLGHWRSAVVRQSAAHRRAVPRL